MPRPTAVTDLLFTEGQRLYDHFRPCLESRRTVFLVGASLEQQSAMRYRLGQELRKSRTISIHYPEHMFSELMYRLRLDLLTLENLLAQSVDAIIVCPESPGSIAELGAFANHPELSKKLIVVGDKRFKRKNGFITLGPIKYLESHATNPSKVIWCDYSTSDLSRVAKGVSGAIRRVHEGQEGVTGLANPLTLEQYTLLFTYVFGPVTRGEIVAGTSWIDVDGHRIVVPLVHASVGILMRRGFLKRDGNVYDVTSSGREQLFRLLTTKANRRSLDVFRVQALTLRTRRGVIFEERAIIS